MFSVYNELAIINSNLKVLKNHSDIVVVQSNPGNESLYLSEGNNYSWFLLPDLAETTTKYTNERQKGLPSKVPALAVSRNVGFGLTKLVSNPALDYLVVVLGDVVISNLRGINKICHLMEKNKKKIAFTRAVDQKFYDIHGNLSRFQSVYTTDFMPQFFILSSDIVKRGYFCNINVSNAYTTEQCLGDEFLRFCTENGFDFMGSSLILSNIPYPYYLHGIRYNKDKSGSILKSYSQLFRKYYFLTPFLKYFLSEKITAFLLIGMSLIRKINIRIKQLSLISPEKKFALVQKNHYQVNSPGAEYGIIGNYKAHEKYPYEEYLLRKIHSPKDKIALDFGCGPGRMILRMNKYFGRVDGVDISPTLIGIAKEWISEKNTKANLFVNDGITLKNISNDTYDFVYSTIAMQHIPVYSTRISLFNEFFRVLKKNGQIAIQMAFTKKDRKEWNNHAEWKDDKWKTLSTNGSCDVLITENSLNLVKEDLEKIGFSNVSFELTPVPHDSDIYSNWVFIYGNKQEN